MSKRESARLSLRWSGGVKESPISIFVYAPISIFVYAIEYEDSHVFHLLLDLRVGALLHLDSGQTISKRLRSGRSSDAGK